MTTRNNGLDQAIANLQLAKQQVAIEQSTSTRFTANEMLQTLQSAGYQIIPPGQQHTQSYNPHNPKHVIREKLANADTANELLDRSKPMPEWARGKEELVLKELEIQLLGAWDHMSPFGR